MLNPKMNKLFKLHGGMLREHLVDAISKSFCVTLQSEFCTAVLDTGGVTWQGFM